MTTAGGRTSVTVRAMRAELVLDEIRTNHDAVSVHALAQLPRLATWTDRILAAAIEDLVDAELMHVDADGQVTLTTRAAA